MQLHHLTITPHIHQHVVMHEVPEDDLNKLSTES
jgi:hypothetical protein